MLARVAAALGTFALASADNLSAQAPLGLTATEISRLPAPEANQGAAPGARHVYAVANSRIAKYDKASGRKVGEWVGSPTRTPHINACAMIGRRLVCANSNYPQIPHTSSVEFIDPTTMRHVSSVPLGPGQGSLTWVDRKDGFWWAGFANYDARGGEPGRDHRWTTVVQYDDAWRRRGAWLLPASVLDRMKPYSNSGGGWGEDGLLYLTGHDAKELYAVKRPASGSVLEHVATIAIPVEGQAIAWDRSRRDRVMFGINRRTREIVGFRVPDLNLSAPR